MGSRKFSTGSAIMFDYQEMSGRQAIIRRDFLYAVVSRLTDEKDVFGFEKSQIEDYLTQRGFTCVVDASADQLTLLYPIRTVIKKDRSTGIAVDLSF